MGVSLRSLFCKMTLTLILLSCLVGVSYQEAYAPYAQYQPLAYYNAFEASQLEQQQYVQGRTGENGAGQRFFFNGATNLNLRLARTSTTTFFFTSVTTATTVDGSTCINNLQFSAAENAATPCKRKRDEAAVLDLFTDDIVESTAAQTIQASAIPDLVKRDADVDPFEIRSSFADSLTDSVYPAKRSFYLTTYVSVTSTITSVFLVRSSTTKTLGDNFASSLKIVCLPSGWGVC